MTNELFQADLTTGERMYLRREKSPDHTGDRRLEDVDYWRKRAGWADDDETMKSYNQGVYNTYYLGDDDGAIEMYYNNNNDSGGGSSEASSSSSVGKSTSQGGASIGMGDHIGLIIGLISAVVFVFMMARCCTSEEKPRKSRSSSAKSRDSSRSLRDRHADRRSRSRSRVSRSRSKSRTRSKSRSTSRRVKEVDEDYKLMDGEEEQSKRSRRRSRSTKRDKHREDKEDRKEKKESKRETMLV